MKPSAPLLWTCLSATLVLGALGYAVAGAWQTGLVNTLTGADIAVRNLDVASTQQLRVALAIALCAPLTLLLRVLFDRLSERASTPAQFLGTLLLVVLGTQAGLGGALFATARVALPSALDASVTLGEVSVDLGELWLDAWALAGGVSAAIMVGIVGGVVTALEAEGA
mgnify:CR=1 FL=1